MKIFIDTAPLIYLIEKHPKYSAPLKKYFTELYIDGYEIITSVITYSEYGVKPKRDEKEELIKEFEEFLEKVGIPMLNVNKSHATRAYEMRAKYKFLKGMDGIQIGTAIEEGCDKFLTNDTKLEKIEELEIVLVDKLE